MRTAVRKKKREQRRENSNQ